MYIVLKIPSKEAYLKSSVAYMLKLQNIYVASISCFETFHFNKETKFTE